MKLVATRQWLAHVPCHAPGLPKPYKSYAQVLQVLRGEEDLRELLDDDDDEDEDFTLDWDELMGPDPFGEGASQALLICIVHEPDLCRLQFGSLSLGRLTSTSSAALPPEL